MIIVHFLSGGRPLCGFDNRVPAYWPADHKWIGVESAKPNLPENHQYCSECLQIWRRAKR